jgi:hypothetical protein
MRYIIDREDFITEGLFSWAKGLLRKGKIKKALKRYNEELPEVKRKIILKEFELQLAKKNEYDNQSELQEELKLLKEDETDVQETLDIAVEEVVKKDPSLKLPIRKLKLEAKKKMSENLKSMYEELAKSGKYKEFDSVIKKRMQQVSDQGKKIYQGLEDLDKQMKKSDSEKKIDKEIFTKVDPKAFEENPDIFKDLKVQYIQDSGEVTVGTIVTVDVNGKINIDGGKSKFDKPFDKIKGVNIPEDQKEQLGEYIDFEESGENGGKE